RVMTQRVGVIALVAAIVIGGVVLTAIASKDAAHHHPVPASSSVGVSGHTLTPQTAEMVGLDGSVQGTIHGLPNDAFSLSLSSDGSRVAFLTAERGTTELATMRLDGSGLVFLSTPGILPAVPVWSHDGSRIAFSGTN